MKIFIIYLILSFSFLYPNPLKIASYNVENLFDDVYNGSEYDEYIPHKYGWGSHMAQIKLEHTAEVICDIDADIIALQEIENRYVLTKLQKLLKQAGCEYRYSAITTKKNAPIQVALLSRYLIRQTKELQFSYSPKIRNILEVIVDIQGYPLHIFVNHWKSKAREGYESKRIRFAKRLKKRLDTLPKNSEYIILGDFNTNYDAYEKISKKIDDTSGVVGLLDILPMMQNGKLASEKLVISSDKYLYDLWLELPYSQRYSHKFYSTKSTLDHIIIPHNMFDNKGIDYLNDSFGVFRKRYLFNKWGINYWQIKHHKHLGKGYSDHLPIYAYFDTKGYKQTKQNYNQDIQLSTIDKLYHIKRLQTPIVLKDIVVIFKRANYAIIKQLDNKKGIFIYGAKGLKEGKIYDIRVNEIASYHGLKEIKSLQILDHKGKTTLDRFYSRDFSQINTVVKDIEGIYKNGYLYTKGKKIAIYFKNRKLKPKSGSRIKIYYAHIGYYNKIQLVIYSKRDFSLE